MKYGLKMTQSSKAWGGIGVVALIAGSAVSCSPAHVEMNRVQRVVPPPTVIIEGESTRVDPPTDPGMPIYLRASYPVESATGLQKWQSWESPQALSQTTLNRSERYGWGNQVATEPATVSPHEDRTVLEAKSGGLRCVFRNRLLDPEQARAWVELKLPAPMGQQDLICVARDQARAGGAETLPQMTIALDDTAVRGGLRWVGTDVRKAVPMGQKQIEFKVSQIITQKQAFGRALRGLLPDGMDQLLNVERQPERLGDEAPVAKQAARCGLSRSAVVQLEMDGERVMRARAFVHTRLLSARTQSQTRWIFTQPDAAQPLVDLDAQEDCRPVRKAWTDCLTDGRACSTATKTFAQANFADLIEASSPGFVSSHLFSATRADANGVGIAGARRMAVWTDPASHVQGAQAVNPLSVEDFQEFVDVIELTPGSVHSRSR